MSDGADTKKVQDAHIETGALSFVDGARAYHALKKHDQQRTKFLLDTITSGALKKWVQEIVATDREHNKKQEEALDAGSTAEWRHTLHDVSLDTNGLFIRLGSHNHGIHAHILYSDLSEPYIRMLRDKYLLSEAERFEINSILGQEDTYYMRTIADGAENCNEADSSSGYKPSWSDAETITYVAKKILSEPVRMFGWKDHVPTYAIAQAVSADTGPRALTILSSREARIDALFDIAERISSGTLVQESEQNLAVRTFARESASAKISKHVYENRSSTIRDPRMYEAIKILKVLLRIPQEELLAMGIHFVRGHFGKTKDGQTTECIGMYSPHGFHRIFIDPDKHLGHGQGKTREREIYNNLPIFSHKDFAVIEAAMLPFSAFLRATRFATFGSTNADIPTVERRADGTIDPEARVRALRGVRKLRSIVVTEVPHESYDTLSRAVKLAEQRIRTGTFTFKHREELEEVLKKIAKEYADYITSKDPGTLINELLAAPVRIDDVAHDAAYFESLPPHTREYANAKGLKPEDLATGARTTVVSALRGDVGYAREAQMWRSLKLERRPTLLYTSGASLAPNDPNALAKERVFARAFVDLAFRYNANVFVPGTATHSTRILAEEYNKKLAEKCGKPLSGITLEERRKHCRFVFFEPGASLIFPGNPHMPTDFKKSGAHFAVSLDGATTGNVAGWSRVDDSDVSYNRQIHARQVNITPLAEGLVVPVLARNGGKWSAVEHQFAAYDNFHILAMKDSGRHSALLAHIQEEKINGQDAIEFFAQQDTLTSFTNAIQDFAAGHSTLREDNDLQEDVFGSRSKAYLAELFELLQSIEPETLVSVDDSTYLGVVEKYFKAHAAQIASENK